ncbi:MAG: helix-turn-helix domain-containing protein [Christensenellales bacterium]|jgi:transcriptional regulator with XRE-family HTH domain
MVDLKTVIATNITYLRKSMNWTQIELAQKINYSDKAVSKWERAESIPDIIVIKEIADLFNVSVNCLLEAKHIENEGGVGIIPKQIKRNHLIIALLSASLVFLIATIVFVFSELFQIQLNKPMWMVYMYALPVAFIVLLVFNTIWGKRIVNFAIITLLVWSILMAIYLSFHVSNIWLIFIIGIPAQIIILLFAKLKPKRK